MGDTIRLMSDWGMWPLYVEDESEPGFGHTSYEYLVDTYGVPRDVIDVIDRWDELYQALYNREDPRESGDFTREQWDAYHEAGRDACRLLRTYLPDDVVLEFAGADTIFPSELY